MWEHLGGETHVVMNKVHRGNARSLELCSSSSNCCDYVQPTDLVLAHIWTYVKHTHTYPDNTIYSLQSSIPLILITSLLVCPPPLSWYLYSLYPATSLILSLCSDTLPLSSLPLDSVHTFKAPYSLSPPPPPPTHSYLNSPLFSLGLLPISSCHGLILLPTVCPSAFSGLLPNGQSSIVLSTSTNPHSKYCISHVQRLWPVLDLPDISQRTTGASSVAH